MNYPAQPDALVVLNVDLPSHSLVTGRVGKILEVLLEERFQVQFMENFDKKVVEVMLEAYQFSPLYQLVTLTEQGFWELIEQAKKDAQDDPDDQIELLIDRLAGMSTADMIAFGDYVDKFHDNAYRHTLWDAAFVICSGCGDDGFMDFRDWLISRGEAIYHEALRDPETLLNVVPLVQVGIHWHGDALVGGMSYVHWYAYERKLGCKFPFYRESLIPSPLLESFEPPGMGVAERDEAAKYKRFPKLTAKFAPTSLLESRLGNQPRLIAR
jgi:hypothetical protein